MLKYLEHVSLALNVKHVKDGEMVCPCSSVVQKSLRLICLIATIPAVTTRLGQPLAGSDDFVLSLSEKARLIGTVSVRVRVS